MSDLNEQLRAEFEAWAVEEDGGNWERDELTFERIGEGYKHVGLNGDWKAYLAGAARRAPAAAPAPVAASVKRWEERLPNKATDEELTNALLGEINDWRRAALAAAPAAAPIVQPVGGPRWQVAAAHARGDLPKGVDLAAEEVRAAISGITGPGFVLRLADLDIASIIYAAIASSADEVKGGRNG